MFESASLMRLADRWWLLLLRGVAAILLGILALVAPEKSLLLLVLLWGAYAFVDGVLNLTMAARRARAGESWGWLLFEGVINVLASIVAFVWPGITALALLVVIAARNILAGAAQIATAVRIRRQIRNEWMLVLSGVLSLAVGVLLLVYPGAGLLSLVWVVGIYSIVFGALLVGLGLRLRRWGRTTARPLPSGAVPTHA